MDFQNRGGAKTGSGAPMSADQAQLDHRERLRRLALETVDIKKVRFICEDATDPQWPSFWLLSGPVYLQKPHWAI